MQYVKILLVVAVKTVTLFSSCDKTKTTVQKKPSKESSQSASAERRFDVTNTTQLLQAMQTAVAGDVIVCSGGDYQPLVATNIQKTGRVVIRAADRANPPIFRSTNSIVLKQVNNFTFDGFKFLGGINKDAFGYPSGRAIRYGFSKNITFRNCVFDFWHIGLDQQNEEGNVNENIVIEYNKCTRRGMDFIRVFRPHRGLTIRNNLLENDFIDTTRSRESDRHPDVIQFAANEPCCAASTRVLIEQNQFKIADLYSHCMFMLSGSIIGGGTPVAPAPAFYFDTVTIRNNDLVAPHVNTIAFGGIKHLLIEGNRIRKTTGTYYVNDPRGRPRINGYGFSSGTIRNNTGPFSPSAQNPNGLTNITVAADNIWGTGAVPSGWVDPSNRVGPYAYEN